MPNEPVIDDGIDRRRIRIGLAMLVIVVIGALVTAALVESALARLVMVLIVVFTVARAFVFSRSLRKVNR